MPNVDKLLEVPTASCKCLISRQLRQFKEEELHCSARATQGVVCLAPATTQRGTTAGFIWRVRTIASPARQSCYKYPPSLPRRATCWYANPQPLNSMRLNPPREHLLLWQQWPSNIPWARSPCRRDQLFLLRTPVNTMQPLHLSLPCSQHHPNRTLILKWLQPAADDYIPQKCRQR